MHQKVQEAIELSVMNELAENVSLEMDEQIIASSHLEDDTEEVCGRIQRTLQSILDETEYCTLVEKKAGHLYKKLDNNIHEKDLNSDIITRIRYLLRTNQDDLLFKTREQAISKIDFLVTCAYLDIYPGITTEELRASYSVDGYNSYDLCITIHAKCLERPMSFIRFDISIGGEMPI